MSLRSPRNSHIEVFPVPFVRAFRECTHKKDFVRHSFHALLSTLCRSKQLTSENAAQLCIDTDTVSCCWEALKRRVSTSSPLDGPLVVQNDLKGGYELDEAAARRLQQLRQTHTVIGTHTVEVTARAIRTARGSTSAQTVRLGGFDCSVLRTSLEPSDRNKLAWRLVSQKRLAHAGVVFTRQAVLHLRGGDLLRCLLLPRGTCP
ncbi:MAG: hypothetical protein MHM6MM_004061, partial [Cercozoa sp. M6MM]